MGEIQAKPLPVRTRAVDVGGYRFAIINDTLQAALLTAPGTPAPTGYDPGLAWNLDGLLPLRSF